MRQWRREGERAPHKPLLILYGALALSRNAGEGARHEILKGVQKAS